MRDSNPLKMKDKVLKFLAAIEKDSIGAAWVLTETIEHETGLSKNQIFKIIKAAEENDIVMTARTYTPGPNGLLAVSIKEKGRLQWEKSNACSHS